jgi:hypothetical protein
MICSAIRSFAGALFVTGLSLLTACDNGTDPQPGADPVQILKPLGGESYVVGTAVTIAWKINDKTKIASIGIKVSTDGGITWPTTLAGRSFLVTETSYAWTPTAEEVSNEVMLMIYEYNDESINSKSGNFTITN